MKNLINKSNFWIIALLSLVLMNGAFFASTAEASILSKLIHRASNDISNLNNQIENDTGVNPGDFVSVIPSPVGPVIIPTRLPSLPSLSSNSNNDSHSYRESLPTYQRLDVATPATSNSVSNSYNTSNTTNNTNNTNIDNSINGSYNTNISGSYNVTNPLSYVTPVVPVVYHQDTIDYGYDYNNDYDYNNNNYDNLSVSCYASPSNPQVGTQMNWYANVSGGDIGYNNNYNNNYNNYNGNYNYYWTGTDGLYGSSQSPYMTYNNPGSKYATVTVRSNNGRSVSATCYANVIQNNVVLAYSSGVQQPLASAVYLNEVPSTGLYDNYKFGIFVGLLALVSAWIAYIVVARKKETGEFNY